MALGFAKPIPVRIIACCFSCTPVASVPRLSPIPLDSETGLGLIGGDLARTSEPRAANAHQRAPQTRQRGYPGQSSPASRSRTTLNGEGAIAKLVVSRSRLATQKEKAERPSSWAAFHFANWRGFDPALALLAPPAAAPDSPMRWPRSATPLRVCRPNPHQHRLVGRQEQPKAGGPRQPLAIAPAHESRSGNWLMTQPLRFEKIPAISAHYPGRS
jgi:hypothetical protein